MFKMHSVQIWYIIKLKLEIMSNFNAMLFQIQLLYSNKLKYGKKQKRASQR